MKAMASALALFVGVLVAIHTVAGQVTFTGNAAFDFDPARLSAEALKSYLKINRTTTPVGTASMTAAGRVTGMAIRNVYFQYDYVTDTLNVGVECRGICGDADGDGNPSGSSDALVVDNPNYCSTEQLSIMLWPEPPASWQPNAAFFNYFFPTVVIGVKQSDCLSGFGSYAFNGRINVLTGEDECPFQLPATSCMLQQMTYASNPGTSGSPSAPGYGANLTELVRAPIVLFSF
jgi:hypothetical protein